MRHKERKNKFGASSDVLLINLSVSFQPPSLLPVIFSQNESFGFAERANESFNGEYVSLEVVRVNVPFKLGV